MESYDMIMIGVLGASTLWGAFKGFAWQLASVASLVISYFAALEFSERLAPLFGQQAPLNRFFAMLAIYAGVSIAIWLFFRLVSGAIERVKLREFDRQAGFLFGGAKGVLWCVVITFFAVTMSEKSRDSVLRSRSGHYIALFLNRADTIMPPELHDVLGPYMHKLEDELNSPAPPASPSPAGESRPAI